MLPPPDVTAAYTTSDGKPTKDFYNWIKSLGTLQGGGGGGGSGSLDWINVKDPPYNAVGDGATDDTAAIQSAIDAAFGPASAPNGTAHPELTKQLYFPAGVFLISNSLIFTKIFGGRIFGAGRMATKIQHQLGVLAFAPSFSFNGCAYTTISDMHITAPFESAAIDLDWDGTAGSSNQSNTLYNLFHDCQVDGGSYGVRIAKSGGSAMGSENLILNCFFIGNGDANQCGIYTNGQNALQNTVVGGNFQNLDTGIFCARGVVSAVYGAGFQEQHSFDIDVSNDTANTIVISGCRTESTNFINSGLIGVTINSCQSTSGSGVFLTLVNSRAQMSGCYMSGTQIQLSGRSKLVMDSCTVDVDNWYDASAGLGSNGYVRATTLEVNGKHYRAIELVSNPADNTTPFVRQTTSCTALADANINGKTFAVGDTIWQNAPAAGGSPGWICTTAGVAGSTAVFKAMANLAP